MKTKEEIRSLLKEIPAASFKGQEVATPWGMMHEVNYDFVKNKIAALKQEYPEYDFRLIQCHDEPYTYSAISIDDPDPREWGEMSKYGNWDEDGIYYKFKDKQ